MANADVRGEIVGGIRVVRHSARPVAAQIERHTTMVGSERVDQRRHVLVHARHAVQQQDRRLAGAALDVGQLDAIARDRRHDDDATSVPSICIGIGCHAANSGVPATGTK